jgi:endonuclease/exonuclease/phosphatase family metal-dependent hydrolase
MKCWLPAVGLLMACSTSEPDAADAGAPPPIVVVTFNTGTTMGLPGIANDGDDYGAEQARLSDTHYGDGLAWIPAVDAVTRWFAEVRPDVVSFQEVFYSELCPEVPEDARAGFVCERWSEGDRTVAQVVLGEGYQVACHPGKNDKCIAVRRAFGRIRQCADDAFCLVGLDGETVDGCGRGARVARATIDLEAGGAVTVVAVHGTSGLSDDDQSCRVRQVAQVFEDMDGAPGADGERNIVLGDLNTDPARAARFDASAVAWNDHVGDGRPFHWVSEVGSDATPTYAGILNIDHLASDAFVGTCAAVDAPPVFEHAYFDHLPMVCELR